MTQRQVPYTNSYRWGLRRFFTALRVWDGYSASFWTLNPGDVDHELTVRFASEDVLPTETYNLDWPNEMKDKYFSKTLPQLRLHEIVAKDPLATCMFYHTFIECILEKLFNCASKPSRLHADCVAGREAGGIAGIVTSYIGVTEPQARESLHLHFLTTILGFQHPEVLRARFKRDFEQTVQDVCLEMGSFNLLRHY